MAPIRSRRFRKLGALAAVVAFVSGWAVDVGGFYDCPHHDLAFLAGAHHHHPNDDHRHDHGPDDVSSLTDAESSPPASHSEHHDGPCTCRTDCTGANPVRAAAPTSVERIPAHTPIRIWAARRTLAPAHIHLPHLLPWPTAPPRT